MTFIAEVPESNIKVKLKNARAKDPQFWIVLVGENQLVFNNVAKLPPGKLSRFLSAQAEIRQLEGTEDEGAEEENSLEDLSPEEYIAYLDAFKNLFLSLSAGNKEQAEAQTEWIFDNVGLDVVGGELMSAAMGGAETEKK